MKKEFEVVRKTDFVRQMMDAGYTRKAASYFIDTFIDIFRENIRNGRAISLPNIGTFKPRLIHAHKCNIKALSEKSPTGDLVPESWNVGFKPSLSLRDTVRSWGDEDPDSELYK